MDEKTMREIDTEAPVVWPAWCYSGKNLLTFLITVILLLKDTKRRDFLFKKKSNILIKDCVRIQCQFTLSLFYWVIMTVI